MINGNAPFLARAAGKRSNNGDVFSTTDAGQKITHSRTAPPIVKRSEGFARHNEMSLSLLKELYHHHGWALSTVLSEY